MHQFQEGAVSPRYVAPARAPKGHAPARAPEVKLTARSETRGDTVHVPPTGFEKLLVVISIASGDFSTLT